MARLLFPSSQRPQENSRVSPCGPICLKVWVPCELYKKYLSPLRTVSSRGPMVEQTLPVASHELPILTTEGASSPQGIVSSFLS